MKYFVIHPTPDTQKLEIFNENNQHLNIEIHPFQAHISNQKLRNELLLNQTISDENIYDLTNLAFMQAHISLWKQAVKDNISITVFETNTITHKDFLLHQKQSLSIKNDYDLLVWGYNLNWNPCVELMPCLPKIIYTFPGYSINELEKENNDIIDTTLYQNSSLNSIQTLKTFSFSGLGCYSLSPKGAKQLLEKINIIGNQAAPSYQDDPHGTNFYVFKKLLKRENISFDIEVNRHIDALNAYMTFPMLAVIPT